LDLPGELRNEVYKHALGLGRIRVPLPAISKQTSQKEKTTRKDTSFDFFAVCHQIGHEAGTLFCRHGTAYIPVSTNLDLLKMHHRMAKGGGRKAFSASECTIHAALHDVKDLHLHMHFQKDDRYLTKGPMHQLLEITRYLSRHDFPELYWGGKRRSITVHLDQYFAKSWRFWPLPGPRPPAVISSMGKGEDIDWTIAYYVDTGSNPEWVPSYRWKFDRVEEFAFLALRVKQYANIQIQIQILGCGKWKEAGMPAEWSRCVTTEATLQSTIWPPTEELPHDFLD
jgi:hypothetical protein